MIYTFRLNPQTGRPKPYYFYMILKLLGLTSHLIFAFWEVGGKPMNYSQDWSRQYSQDYRLVQKHECATHLVLDENNKLFLKLTLLEPFSWKDLQSLCDCHSHRTQVSCIMMLNLGRNQPERGYLTSLKENWELNTGQEVGLATFSSRFSPVGFISSLLERPLMV